MHHRLSIRYPAAAWRRGYLGLLVALAFCGFTAAQPAAADPFADAVVSFTPGAHAGFGAENLPDVVLGPPVGGGDLQGSLDVVSLGDGGTITLAFRDNIICDQPGPDFTVFENAFHAGALVGPLFIEVGIVAVSQDGEHFVTFPYDPHTFAGLAGQTPVYSNPDNGIDPTDPAVSGGDHFDLADVGLPWAAYVRITDPGDAIPDSGSRIPAGISGGFDLDAMAAIHSCAPNSTPSPTPTPTPDLLTGDLNNDGIVDESDLTRLIDALFGDDEVGGADVNADTSSTAADCPALIAHLGERLP